MNVATTRLILTQAGEYGLLAAGGVIKSFGEFVAGSQIVVGIIIFIGCQQTIIIIICILPIS